MKNIQVKKKKKKFLKILKILILENTQIFAPSGESYSDENLCKLVRDLELECCKLYNLEIKKFEEKISSTNNNRVKKNKTFFLPTNNFFFFFLKQ